MEKTMEKRNLVCAAAVSAALMLAGCGSDDKSSTDPHQIPVPGIDSTVSYSYDLGTVDAATGTYYVTDRTNKSIDVVNIASLKVTAQFKPGFFGCALYPTTAPTYVTAAPGCNAIGGVAANNDTSGPDGLDVVGAYLYAGDVGKLWVLNKTTGAVSATIAIPSAAAATAPVLTTTVRADEGCFDSVDNIYAISTPGDANPFMTFLDTTVPGTPTVIAKVVMNSPDGSNSAGLEACTYDPATGTFFVNNDGSDTAPNGEMDGIPAAAIVALKAGAPQTVGNGAGGWQAAIAGFKVLALPALCDPTGIALGKLTGTGSSEIGAMCRPGTLGHRMDFVILDSSTGATTTVAGAGGGDQITYDAGSKKWYLADSRMTATGNSCGGGSASCVLTPMLTIVDGTTLVVTKKPNGNNAHSVAVGGGYAFTPFNKPSATAGGAGFDANGTGAGGINAFPL